MDDVLNFFRQSISNLQHKGNLVSLQVQTSHFLIEVNAKKSGTYFVKKTAQKIDRIENNPLAVNVTLLTIYQ